MGGFGQTFEVDDRGTLKVLKVLNPARFSDPRSKQKVVSLFQQEAEVLSQLHHSGIPKVDSDGYFPFWPKDSQEPLHCLVMEKIDGLNLQEWLEGQGNQPITPVQALNWLKQLAEILEQVHQKQYFHRDIKPPNIMLRPDGQLVLIDFGAVRELTQTYLQQQNVTGTVIGTPGYTPPEQMHGRAVPQSDFFALGRTFVHLLTGRHPLDLHENPQTGKLIWRNSVPHISKSWVDLIYKLLGRSLADFIDELMEPSWKKRPKSTRVILKRLKKILRAPLVELAAGAAVLFVVGVTGIYWYLTGVNGCSKIWLRSFSTGDNLSCGEEILVRESTVPEKQQGVNAFAAGQYQQAVPMLEQAWKKQYDPETLIYLNNARLAAQNTEAHTIAVAAPINEKSLDTAYEILRGVAQAQDEFNRNRKPGQLGLKVLIANDNNDPDQGKAIAKALVSKRDILGVIGHYASEVTLAAVPVYEQHQLVSISPGSTSEDLSNKSPFFFRTTSSDRNTAQALANYLITQAQQRRVAIFYNPQSNYSKSIYSEFHRSFTLTGGQVVKEFDLSVSSFRADVAIDQAQKQGATALVLLPDGQTSRNTFRNALQVITANQSRYWMVGGDTLYGPETLQQRVTPDALSRLVLAVHWHRLSSPNEKFPPVAKELWRGDVSWRTALAYDATSALIAALEQLPQNRTGVQKALAASTFKATGATGVISFRSSGDRNEFVKELVKVVPSSCSPDGLIFVPVSDKAENLEDCRKKQ
jgi:ABC-type branched-subunit amino acid transport system substrate-binding protein/tRNA A-37 threonylcarbamoyl transferase component Bud32